jgi:hypothetical protein
VTIYPIRAKQSLSERPPSSAEEPPFGSKNKAERKGSELISTANHISCLASCPSVPHTVGNIIFISTKYPEEHIPAPTYPPSVGFVAAVVFLSSHLDFILKCRHRAPRKHYTSKIYADYFRLVIRAPTHSKARHRSSMLGASCHRQTSELQLEPANHPTLFVPQTRTQPCQNILSSEEGSQDWFNADMPLGITTTCVPDGPEETRHRYAPPDRPGWR